MLKLFVKNLMSYAILVVFLFGCSDSKNNTDPGVGKSGDEQPAITMSCDPTDADYNGNTTLTWSTENANSCVASGSWSGDKDIEGSEELGPLTGDVSYSLTCTGDGGETIETVNVTVGDPPTQNTPTVSLNANPSSVNMNGETELTWTTSNVDTCTASGADSWSSGKATSGSETIDGLTETSTFALECTGPNGSADASVTVVVNSSPGQTTVSLSADPTTVNSGGTTTLTWSSENANECEATGAWDGRKDTSGTETSAELTQTGTFTLTCTGDEGSDTASVEVVVSSDPLPPTVTLSADPTSVDSGGTTTLTWSSENANECEATGAWDGRKDNSGTETSGELTQTGTFTLTCTGDGGSDSASVEVEVSQGPDQPTVTISADPAAVTEGETTTLTWSSENTVGCEATGAWDGEKDISGTETTGALETSSTFGLTCENSDGVPASAEVRVVVQVEGSGTATLSWIPPTTYADPDNTPLEDLAGFIIYYGQEDDKDAFSKTVNIDDPGLVEAPEDRVEYTVEGLAAGTWYFRVSAFNSTSVESDRSNEADTDIVLP